jgi:hypothetical protein
LEKSDKEHQMTTPVTPEVPVVTETPVVPPATLETPVVSTPEPKDLEAEAAKWKELSRKHEAQSKANAAKAKQFDDLEEASKTELQKAADRAVAAEKQLADITARALRAEVAANKGVPAHLLSGSTQEDLEASADALIAFRGNQPKPDMGGGDRGGNVTGPVQLTDADVKNLQAQGPSGILKIEEARLAGQLDTLLGYKK